MKINENTAEVISLEEAVAYTHAYQKNNPDAPKAFFYTTLFIGLCPLLILLYKRKATLFSHPFVPFLVLTAVATVYEYVGSIVLKINTAYWSQVYSLLEVL